MSRTDPFTPSGSIRINPAIVEIVPGALMAEITISPSAVVTTVVFSKFPSLNCSQLRSQGMIESRFRVSVFARYRAFRRSCGSDARPETLAILILFRGHSEALCSLRQHFVPPIVLAAPSEPSQPLAYLLELYHRHPSRALLMILISPRSF